MFLCFRDRIPQQISLEKENHMVTRFGKGLARLVGRPVKYADGTGGWLTGETGQKMGESDSLDLLEVGNGQQQFPFCIRLPWRSGPIFSKFHLQLLLFFS